MKRNNNKNREGEEEKDTTNINVIPILPPSNNNLKKIYNIEKRNDVNMIKYNQFMMCCDNFFTLEECEKWILYAETLGFEKVYHEQTKEIAYRNHYRQQFDNDVIGNKIYERISTVLPESMKVIDNKRAITCSPNIRVYKYEYEY